MATQSNLKSGTDPEVIKSIPHAPIRGPLYWDWRCLRCDDPVSAPQHRLSQRLMSAVSHIKHRENATVADLKGESK